ncbi:MAG: diaminopimelate epimerase [Bacteroidales bacterium]|nr:diaminopimelate epimerase [Bacteroidales bacterium]
MKFYKYHGTGNDFIVIDGRNEKFTPNEKIIQQLCDRNFGIGSDGLLLLKSHQKYDFEMNFYNPDGSEATFCGNGARCIVAFAKYLNIIDKETTFLAKDGEHSAYFENDEVVLKMIDIDDIKTFGELFYTNTGTHHVVKFVDNVDAIDIMNEAPKIRYQKDFEPFGTNVNFVQKCNGFIKVRTYEKGVEKETLSCGTGVVASALIYAYTADNLISKVNIQAKGGNLKVTFEKTEIGFKNVFLQGNAVKVFSGNVDI